MLQSSTTYKIQTVFKRIKTPRILLKAGNATFKTDEYKLHKLESGPPKEITLSKEEALECYKKMVTIRRFESASGNLYKSKIVRGFCHLYSGQEAVAVGIHSHMRNNDALITSYRAHGWALIMGIQPIGVMAELAGRWKGCARGKGGSMHMYGDNFYGGNGIVGAQVPLGTGIALAAKYKNTDGVCVTCYGDGAANQGQVFEAYNIAALLNLPVIFVCENNRYAMGTSTKRHMAGTDFYTRGDYIPGIWLNGMDLCTVKAASKFAIDYVSGGKGPLVIEAHTYRYGGHSMSDPGTSYRSREEVKEVREKLDPISQFKQKILDVKLVTEDELKTIDAAIKKEIDNTVKDAKNEKEISVVELSYDIYAKFEVKIRNVTPFKSLQHKVTGVCINIK